MSQQDHDALRLPRLASTGRLALACALELRRLLGLASRSAAAVSDPDLARDLRDALSSAGAVARLLVTAGQRPSTTEIVDLGNLVEEARDLIDTIAGPDAIAVIVRAAPHVRVVANRGDLEQILVNLIDAPCDGELGPRRLTITTDVIAWPGGGAGGSRAAQLALLSLVDDRRHHVTSPAQPCTRCGAVPAIGLSLVRAIAAAHGGELAIVSGRDGSVECRVVLPLAPRDHVASSVAPATLPGAKARQVTDPADGGAGTQVARSEDIP